MVHLVNFSVLHLFQSSVELSKLIRTTEGSNLLLPEAEGEKVQSE